VSNEPLIAVIDDDQSFQAALVELLGSFGYGVRGFASADEFVANGIAGPYGCIITDLHMPGMSGLDLKQHLVSCACRVPVIMITPGEVRGRRRPAQEAVRSQRLDRMPGARPECVTDDPPDRCRRVHGGSRIRRVPPRHVLFSQNCFRKIYAPAVIGTPISQGKIAR
jgi:CheY-like chemotaxis protein